MGQHGDTLRAIARAIEALGVPQPIIDSIVGIVMATGDPALISAADPARTPTTLAEVARRFHRYALQRRAIVGGGLVADTAWHMLLALFADAEDDIPVSVTSLVYASGSPYTTALRYIAAMEAQGLLRRSGSPAYRPTYLIRPTNRMMDMMRDTIPKFCVPEPAKLV